MRILLFAVLLCSGCTHVVDDCWIEQDKVEHFVASAALASVGSEYADRQHYPFHQSNRIGILFSLSFGVSKELFDSRGKGNGWSWKNQA